MEQKVENYLKIKGLLSDLKEELSLINNDDDKIDMLNYVRKEIHEVSPLKHHPVDCVLWEKSENIEGNEYNPNSVAPPEMRLLIDSIIEDGYTMPIVTFPNANNEIIKIVDGFHRRKSERTNKEISQSTKGRIPLTHIRKSQEDVGNRMASTIRHNRARGTHNIELMSNIVAELVEIGKGDAWICKHIGMSADELLRLKQITGLASMFKDHDYSNSWT